MKKLLLIGGGGHCNSCIDVIEQEGLFTISGIIDKSDKLGTKILGYDVIGTDDDLPELSKMYEFMFITIGQIKNSKTRTDMFYLLKNLGVSLPTIVSPRAYVSKHSQVGEGSIIMHDALVNAKSTIGKNCILNSKSLCEHDVIVENFCHISTGAILNGGVHVRNNSFVGSNTVLREGCTIEPFSIITFGSKK